MSSDTEVPITAPAAPPSEPIRLARHLQRTAGGFSLAFARWNHPGQEDAVMPAVRAACGLPIQCVSVADVPVEGVLPLCISAAGRTNGDPLFVFGLYRHFPNFLHVRNGEAPRVLTMLNLQRELFRKQMGCPLVFWLPEHALELIAQKAPDFWSWRSGAFDFDLPREIWIDAGHQLRLRDGVQLNLKGADVPRTIGERLGVWLDLTAGGAISPREQRSAAGVATDLFDLYARAGDVILADDWYTRAIELLHLIQRAADPSSLTHAEAAHAEGLLWSRYPRGNRGENLHRATACYRAALRVYTEAEFPQGWATTQNNLGNAYQDLPTRDRGDNLKEAIACYRAALRVRTETDFPQDWAATQNNLGIAYSDLPTGDRGENLRNAIARFQGALQVYTRTDFPQDWAAIQNNLGLAYWDLPTGDRGENLRNTIARFQGALQVYTRTDFPQQWAATQNNLGLAYWDLLMGDRGENLRNAIACYEAALQVYTRTDLPQQWAATQNNLGNAYQNLPIGDRGENLRHAIACFNAALAVYTEASSSQNWATIQNNLGAAYSGLPASGPENLQHAIACFQAALRVRTEADFPQQWAMTQNNLGIAYSDLPTGDRSDNLKKATACYRAALRVRTEADFPQDWAMTQFNQGLALLALAGVTGSLTDLQAAMQAFQFAERGFMAVGVGALVAQARAQIERVQGMLKATASGGEPATP